MSSALNDPEDERLQEGAAGDSSTELTDLSAPSAHGTTGAFARGRGRPFNEPHHNANTRRGLAWASLGLLVAFYAAAFVCILADVLTMDELMQLVPAFSGLQTLAAVAFGFYFAKER